MFGARAGDAIDGGCGIRPWLGPPRVAARRRRACRPSPLGRRRPTGAGRSTARRCRSSCGRTPGSSATAPGSARGIRHSPPGARPSARDRRADFEDANLLVARRASRRGRAAPARSPSARTSAPTTPDRRRSPHRRVRRAAASRERRRLMTHATAIDRIVAAALEEDAPWGDITCEMLIPRRPRPPAPISSRASPACFSGGEVFAAAFRLDRPAHRRRAARRGRRRVRGGRRARRACTGPARGVLSAERIGAELRAADVGHRDAHGALRRRGRPHRRAHRRHPQDHARPARPRAARGARRRRAQPPPLALGRRDGQGQPPRRARRRRASTVGDALQRAHARGCRTPRTSRSRSTASTRSSRCSRPASTRSCSTTSRSTTCARASSTSPGAPSSRHPAACRSTRCAAIADTGVDVISVGALTHSARALDLGLDVDASPRRSSAVSMLYLDNAATTPVRREVLEAMLPFLTGGFGNPSSHTRSARRPRAPSPTRAPTSPRVLGCRAGDVVFTSRRHRGRTTSRSRASRSANPRGRGTS